MANRSSLMYVKTRFVRLNFVCEDSYLADVLAFAQRTKQLDNLLEKFEYLDNYADRKCVTIIGTDFAPYSFSFCIKRDGEVWFNGGMIYHGDHDGYGSGSAPTFSVTLDKATGWRIHT